MKFLPRANRTLLLASVVSLTAVVLADQQPAGVTPAEAGLEQPAEQDEANAGHAVAWPSGLDEAQRRALAERKPLLIRVGVAWCPVCRKLAEEIQKPQVQAELHRWTRVHVDADRSPADAERLHAAVFPSLRIHTPGGQTVATRDGYLSAQELVNWLAAHYEAALAAPDDALLASGQPDAVTVVRLVRQFGRRDPAIREAAIRRLLPYPQVSRVAVVRAFREGSLSVRLAALELLRAWRAPVEAMDPWRPQTVTSEHLAGLEKWTEQEIGEPSPPQELSEEQLASARRQIERMLESSQAEALAIRERLARLGPALLPEAYDRLKQAATDQDRQRLLALRYRLVAEDTLVLRWPGGISRLAATDSRERQQAAAELAKLVTGDDQQLLLELFSDPDPLVREISLRGLQHIGGKEATAALVKLLADPEPNVRAAVLKQLEEDPQKRMVPEIAEYLKTEKDPDLIVHAIRFLRATGGPAAAESLMSLLKHESWQVRAEAAAGLGSAETSFRVSSYGSGMFDDEDDEETSLRADVYVALLKLLDDADAFVVSRAVQGLANVDMAVAVEPLVNAAEKHPEMAAEIIDILARGEHMRAKALPHLRGFCKHADPAIRAAAVAGLSSAAPDSHQQELTAALQDGDSRVRIAAASSLFRLAETHREERASAMARRVARPAGLSVDFPLDPDRGPESSDLEVNESLLSRVARMLTGPAAAKMGDETEAPSETEDAAQEASPDERERVEDAERPAAGRDAEETADEDESDSSSASRWDEWLEGYYAGRGRPDWLTELIPLLEAMLRAESAEERVTAAQALVPLGKAAAALPVLVETARSHPELFDHATRVLPWLLWEPRRGAFEQLQELARYEGYFSSLVNAMTAVPDRRAAELFWKLLADEELTLPRAVALHRGLSISYLGSPYFSPSEINRSARRGLVREAKPRAAAGSELQRLTALALLAAAAPETAAEAAANLVDDPGLSDELRRDAFQILLGTLPEQEAVQMAIAALNADDASRRQLALTRLVEGAGHLGVLRDVLHVGFEIEEMSFSYGEGAPILPEPPPGLQVEQVRPLIDDPDPKIAAYAGYLLTLLGEKEGLDPLLRYWRGQDGDDDRVSRLVYRAVAVLDDSRQIIVLEEIYDRLDRWEMQDFYWTIRIMSGPEILRFRKRIRDEVGMSNLQ